MKQITETAKYKQKIDESKFIGFCYPVESKDEAETYIEKIRGQHNKATHVCPAYRIYGENDILEYNSDDGEPSRSAGPPIAAAIKGKELINTLCIVVRYFGGIELGIGGLIRAYRGTASETLEKAKTIEYVKKEKLIITSPHKSYSNLIKTLQSNEVDFEQDYTKDGAEIELELPEKKSDDLINDLKLISGVDIKRANT